MIIGVGVEELLMFYFEIEAVLECRFLLAQCELVKMLYAVVVS